MKDEEYKSTTEINIFDVIKLIESNLDGDEIAISLSLKDLRDLKTYYQK
jgi:hypothetical protein